MDLTETIRFLTLLEELEVRLVNITAGSPYYNPHIQRLRSIRHRMGMSLLRSAGWRGAADENHASMKHSFRISSSWTAYSYLQDFLPNVAQPAVREGWTDLLGSDVWY